MPKSLEKTRKHIAKKRNGTVEALHQFSRDSRRLARASLRDEKLGKLAHSRSKKEQPLLERATFFQDAMKQRDNKAQDLSGVHEIITQFIETYEEELADLKKTRRPGRPPMPRQVLVEKNLESLREEQKNGFYIPDLTMQSNIDALERWEGSWSYLTTLAWVRLAADNTVKSSQFPPT